MTASLSARMKILEGDITRLQVEAIVNAANNSLLGGGGVDGAIHRAAGPQLLAECRRLGGCKTGQARMTKGYRLPADYVIHTVGPVWQGGEKGEPSLLADCYNNSLRLAAEKGIKTVAFPSISTGVYGYPIGQACRIALRETASFLRKHERPQIVTFVCFNREDYETYRCAMDECMAASPD